MAEATTDVMHEIENEIRNNKVMIYMKGNPSFPQCGFSAATIEIFQELGKPFQTVDVLSDPAKREAIKRYSNWPTIPQIYIDGKFVGGCDIVRELHTRGELQSLVDRAFADR
jgi:monothiol glutaredoxin